MLPDCQKGRRWLAWNERVRTEGEVVSSKSSERAHGAIDFAAFSMVMGGIWWIFTGFAAIVTGDFFALGREYTFEFSVSTWGWIHMLLGVAVLVAGGFIFIGAAWARLVGVIVAVVWAIVAFAWTPYYPVWGIALLAISITIIWALTVHGSDYSDGDKKVAAVRLA